jgi:8-oxo-dGTP pyrophosphatase MutT (NUDIX family)
LDWRHISIDQVRAGLALQDFDVARAQLRMAPIVRPLRRDPQREGSPRLAAVLVLLFPSPGGLMLVLIRRHEYEGVHSGQISLPGGKHEDTESFWETALRETDEELGIAPHRIRWMGNLTPLYIPPSDFEVHPFVGYTPDHPQWTPDPLEVAEVIEVPLSILFDDSLKRSEEVARNGVTFQMPYYAINGHKVWGATAIMLSELEGRLRQVIEPGAH